MRVTATGTLVLLLLSMQVFAGGEPDGELGTEDHPIVWALVPRGEDPTAAGEVAARIQELTGIWVQAAIANSYADILEALAAGPSGAHMTVLPALPYLAAVDRDLVQPGLLGVRAEASSYATKIIVHTEAGIEALSELPGRSFARPGPFSDGGWVIPTVMMRAEGFDPEELGAVNDVANYPAVVEAVYNRDSDAGAIPVGGLTAFYEEYEDLDEQITVLAESPRIPNEGVQFDPQVPQELREQITNALLQLIETPEGNELIRRIYSWDALERASDDAYTDLRALVDQAELSTEEMVPQLAAAVTLRNRSALKRRGLPQYR